MDVRNKTFSSTKVKSKGNVKEEKEKHTELAGKIDETDEMKLKMLAGLDKADPEDAIYPAELNAHLIEQLKIMTSENNQLRKCIFTKDEVIKQLNKTIADLNQRIRDIISGSGPAISSKSAGVISAKITGLCKQNRHLIAEIESYKTKNAALERKLMQLNIMNSENEKLEACLCKEDGDANSDELKDLNNKLSIVNKKLYESKNRNLELKNDILIATKILQQELGDKFTSIKDLQNDIAGWKGRAQQIVLLQARVSELEEKLHGKQKDTVQTKWKDQNQIIRELEMKKKKEADQAIKDADLLKEDNQDLKKKLEGARCRIRNLECDSTLLRQKIQTFLEKSNHDDLLINEQRNQIKNLEIYYQEILKENTSKFNKINGEVGEYKKLIKNTDAKIDALRQQASEKAMKIEELRAQLLRYEECSLQSIFFTPMKTATDNEIKKLSELVLTLNERLDAERRKWEDLDSAHRKLKERNKRVERRLTSLVDEIKILKDTSKRGSKTSKTLLSKEQILHENIAESTVLRKLSSTAALEKPSTVFSGSPVSEEFEALDKEDLKYKLELADEKFKIMEDKLRMIEEEKLEDCKNFTEMIQTSKQLFHEALAVLKREKCQCM
ncbi:coiled-coil domain-containing protein 13 [Bicyclus anynana]|uniref:Coiled-coil domain-containing protein 13 n=1 Tax=Bicyclus anynana TaxID=110368 RepID=A0A6J1N5B3_BICAN|nr:coiled-coil domain-containing protein 13 [Bicyclus anynana]